MGSFVVVEVAVGAEAVLGLGEVGPVVTGEQVRLEGAVEAFVLALSLRVERSAVDDMHAQAQQPDGECGVLGSAAGPGRSVVAEDLFGQAVTGENVFEARMHGGSLFVRAGFEAERITGVVVEHGERMTASAALEGEVTLKVHLPELIGLGASEALMRPVRIGSLRLDTAMTTQDAREGAHGGQRGVP